MISGFNTDVEFDNVVYHVQTEDKGLKARIIVSLVYDGGTILASKRVSYDDLLSESFDEKVLSERVKRQHQLICAAVRAGRMGELKQMSTKIAPAKETPIAGPLPEIGDVSVQVAAVEPPQVNVAAVANITRIATAALPLVENGAPEIIVPAVTIPQMEYHPTPRPDVFADAPLFEGVSVIDEAEILPAEAVVIVSELSGTERPSNTKLSVEILGDSKFKGGDRRTVSIMVCRSTERKVVNNAEIMIKVLGSSFRPLIFHAKSDVNGLAKVHMQLPHFDAGRAALLIRAMNNGEEIELRRIVTPG